MKTSSCLPQDGFPTSAMVYFLNAARLQQSHRVGTIRSVLATNHDWSLHAPYSVDVDRNAVKGNVDRTGNSSALVERKGGSDVYDDGAIVDRLGDLVIQSKER